MGQGHQGGREPAHIAEYLTCERCGYVEQIEFPVDINGSQVTAADYIASLHAAGIPVLCSGCAGDDRAAEDIYRNNDED